MVAFAMADTTVSEETDALRKPISVKQSKRKTSKSLMEKNRRARMNKCLSQMKALVLQAMKKDVSQFSKLEKADILEMTVKHLKATTQQLRQHQLQQLSVNGSACTADNAGVIGKYKAGFNECANEVLRYMDTSNDITEDFKSKLLRHISVCLNSRPGEITHPGKSDCRNNATVAHSVNSNLFTNSVSNKSCNDANNLNNILTVSDITQAMTVLPPSNGLLAQLPIQGAGNSIPVCSKLDQPSGTSSLQLIPGALPSGQLVFFLPPSCMQGPISAIPVYATPATSGNKNIQKGEITPPDTLPSETENVSDSAQDLSYKNICDGETKRTGSIECTNVVKSPTDISEHSEEELKTETDDVINNNDVIPPHEAMDDEPVWRPWRF